MSGKKNFSLDYNTDPIMQFITPPQDNEEPDTQAEQEPKQKKPRAKKAPTQKAPSKWSRDPSMEREKRTKRVQLVLPPSLFEAAKDLAEGEGISFNEFFIRSLESAVEKGEK